MRAIIVETSVTSVVVLGLIVLIRTILSVCLDVEIDGTLPWRQGPGATGTDQAPAVDGRRSLS